MFPASRWNKVEDLGVERNEGGGSQSGPGDPG